MAGNKLKTAIATVGLVAGLSGNTEAGNIDKNILETQEKYKTEIAKNLGITGTQLSKLGLFMEVSKDSNTTSEDGTDDGYIYIVNGKKTNGTLVAGPAMLKQSYTAKNGESGHFEFDSQADLDLFLKYSEKLGAGMEYLANELVKGKKEFIDNYMIGDDKEDDETIEEIEEWWEDIVRIVFLKDTVNDDLPYLVKYAPNLAQYIRENGKDFDIKEVTKSLDDIILGDKYKAEGDKYKAEGDKYKKITDNFNKIIGE